MKLMKVLLFALFLLLGCGRGQVDEGGEEGAAPAGIQLSVEAPAPMDVPESREASSDTDWEAKAHNKNIEIVQVLNIINPIAAYITQGFKEYGNRFSPTLQEEWEDTQVQLTKALTLYEDCKARREAGSIDKELFLDLEEVWQLLVKTGVAGVRTKSMVDSELQKITT